MISFRFLPLAAVLLAPADFSGDFPAKLQPRADKYVQERHAVDNARARQGEIVRARYAAALGKAQTAGTSANQGGSLAAAMKKVKADIVPAAFPADLPRTLVQGRREFATGMDALEKATAARTREVNARYLQLLAPLEQVAAHQKNVALAEAVAGEKARVLAATTAAVGPALRKNPLKGLL